MTKKAGKIKVNKAVSRLCERLVKGFVNGLSGLYQAVFEPELLLP